jgi:hypothetical protein
MSLLSDDALLLSAGDRHISLLRSNNAIATLWRLKNMSCWSKLVSNIVISGRCRPSHCLVG